VAISAPIARNPEENLAYLSHAEGWVRPVGFQGGGRL
jgi:hypothetical protein